MPLLHRGATTASRVQVVGTVSGCQCVHVATVNILGYPSSAAAYCVGVEQAPAALRDAGVISAIQAAGHRVNDVGDLPVHRYLPRAWRPGSFVHVCRTDMGFWERSGGCASACSPCPPSSCCAPRCRPGVRTPGQSERVSCARAQTRWASYGRASSPGECAARLPEGRGPESTTTSAQAQKALGRQHDRKPSRRKSVLGEPSDALRSGSDSDDDAAADEEHAQDHSSY